MHSAPEVDGGEPMHTDGRGGRGRGGRRRAGRGAELTAAEWMVDIPSDLGRSWSVLARPSGVRCLVTSSGGETTRHNKSGGILGLRKRCRCCYIATCPTAWTSFFNSYSNKRYKHYQ